MANKKSITLGRTIENGNDGYHFILEAKNGLPVLDIEKTVDEDENPIYKMTGPNGEDVIPQGAGGGSTVVVDDEMSSISENPVQNKVITGALALKQNKLYSGGAAVYFPGNSYGTHRVIYYQTYTDIELEGNKLYKLTFCIREFEESGEAGMPGGVSYPFEVYIINGQVRLTRFYSPGYYEEYNTIHVSVQHTSNGKINLRFSGSIEVNNVLYGGNLVAAFSIQELENNLSSNLYANVTCFIEGTKVLTRTRDGVVTEKNIEDITTDDLVAFWNPDTGKLTQTRVLVPVISGECTEYNRLFFSDGTTVDVYGNQMFWEVDSDKLVNYKSFEKGMRFCKDNGDIVEFDHLEKIVSDHPVKHYTIVAFRNRYLANGLMVGGPRDKFYPNMTTPEYIEYWNKLNEKDQNILKKSWANGMTRREWRNSELYRTTMKPFIEERAKQGGIIAKNKKYLDDTDYLVTKFMEGVITEEEFAPTRTKRQEARDAINAAEEVLEQSKEAFKFAEEQVKEQCASVIVRKYKGKFIGKTKAIVDDVEKKKK